jgi:hypothetical protein
MTPEELSHHGNCRETETGYIRREDRQLDQRSRSNDGVRRLSETDSDMPDAWRDPLAHPAIRAMSAREVADLPFAAGYGKRPGK